jgi:hypothetical protein
MTFSIRHLFVFTAWIAFSLGVGHVFGILWGVIVLNLLASLYAVAHKYSNKRAAYLAGLVLCSILFCVLRAFGRAWGG